MELNIIINKAKEFEKQFDPQKINRAHYLISHFNELFPKTNIDSLTLHSYVVDGTKNTFSYWLEYGTVDVANIGGRPADKYYVWSNKELIAIRKFKMRAGRQGREIDESQALGEFSKIKLNIKSIIASCENNKLGDIDSESVLEPIVKMKIAYLYYPEKFTSIMTIEDIKDACRLFGINYTSPAISNNLLYRSIKAIDIFKDWSSYKIGNFYYSALRGNSEKIMLDDNAIFWHLAPGRGAYLWQSFKTDDRLGYEWSDPRFENLTELTENTYERIAKTLRWEGGHFSITRYLSEVKRGDYICVISGEDVLGISRAIEDYTWPNSTFHFENDERESDFQTVKIKWIKQFERPLKFLQKGSTAAFQQISNERLNALKKLLKKNGFQFVLQNTKQTNTTMTPRIEAGSENGSGQLTNQKNLILFGPPGTGKTYSLKKDFFPMFTKTTTKSKDQYVLEKIENGDLTWLEIITIILAKSNKGMTVPEIKKHPYIIYKSNALNRQKNVDQTIWDSLQRHTVLDSKTVQTSTSNRLDPFMFNKFIENGDSIWKLVDKLPEDIQEKKTDIDSYSDRNEIEERFKFCTFHQSFNYEDFVEGIKPFIPKNEEEEINNIQYDIQDGLLKIVCQKALQLTGFKGLISDFCNLSKEERKSYFKKETPVYALFIDEINRGNVSKIFGELITLIEKDKRLSEENELIVDLPYSQKRFGVPPNLFFIATMNTADRSVEALDTALRRRFDFREYGTDYNLIKEDVGGINLRAMLMKINSRIEKLLDTDHCIGHSYLMEIDSFEEIKENFSQKILPLLKEFFYGDFGKIGLILGKDFIIDGTKELSDIFTDFDYEFKEELKERKIFRIADISTLSKQSFINIYNK